MPFARCALVEEAGPRTLVAALVIASAASFMASCKMTTEATPKTCWQVASYGTTDPNSPTRLRVDNMAGEAILIKVQPQSTYPATTAALYPEECAEWPVGGPASTMKMSLEATRCELHVRYATTCDRVFPMPFSYERTMMEGKTIFWLVGSELWRH